MKISSVYIIGAQVAYASLSGEYQTSTKYTQRAKVQNCPSFPAVENAQYNCADDALVHSSSCTVSCIDGYKSDLPEQTTECKCYQNMGVILLPIPCEWSEVDPVCELKAGLFIPTCPELPAFDNGTWSCTAEELVDGEACYSICDEGFQLEEANIKMSKFDCDCTGTIEESQCVFSQRNAVLQLAQRSFPSRVVSSVNSIGNGPETNWDMSMFRSGTAILPRCIAIVTQVESETGEVVELNQCPSLPDIDNGMFVCSSSNVIGSICKTICDAGFVGTGYGDQNKVKCVRNNQLAGTEGEYDWSKNVTDITCLPISEALETGGFTDVCVDPRGESEEEQANFAGYFTCENFAPGLFISGEICELTCLNGYKLQNPRRTNKVCACRRGDCKWKFEGKTMCVPDEEILSKFGIFREFMEQATPEAQLEFAETHLKGKTNEILAIRREQIEMKEVKVMLGMQRSLQRIDGKRIKAENLAAKKIANKKSRMMERALIFESIVQECPPLAYDPISEKAPRCTGNSAGSSCRFKCEKGYSLQSHDATYCTCNKKKKCQWSHRSKCVVNTN